MLTQISMSITSVTTIRFGMLYIKRFIYRKVVGNEDVNMATIKQIVTTFSSIIASRSLQVLEEHLFENLSYMPVIHDLLGDLNIHHSVYPMKQTLSIHPVGVIVFSYGIDNRGI